MSWPGIQITLTMHIQKINSGGQNGVDQAALDVAINRGIDCGGWCPPGRVCESGLIPPHYPLDETPSDSSDKAPDIPRSLRTEWNVRDADATLILLPKELKNDKGTEWTIQCALTYQKPYLIADPFEIDTDSKISSWFKTISIKVLNIAGPSEITYPGIGDQTKKLLSEVFT